MSDTDGIIGIVDAAYCLPGDPIDLRDWAGKAGVPAERVARLERNGCRYFHQSYGQSDAALIAVALRDLAARGHDLTACDVVLHAHTQQFSVPAAPASLLAETCTRFGIAPRLALSVGQLACASVVRAVALARDLLRANPAWRQVLLVTSDRVFGGAQFRLRQDAGLQSDGASAMLIGRAGLRARLGAVHERYHDNLHAGPGAAGTAGRADMNVWLHSRQLMRDALEAGGRGADGFAAFMPNNADGPHWRKIALGLGFTDDQVLLDNIRLRGHSCCSDLAINLVDRGFALLASGRPVLAFSQSNLGAYGAVTFEQAA